MPSSEGRAAEQRLSIDTTLMLPQNTSTEICSSIRLRLCSEFGPGDGDLQESRIFSTIGLKVQIPLRKSLISTGE